MAQPRPNPGQSLPPLMELIDVPMDEPDSPRADRAVMLQLQRDYESLADQEQLLFWNEVEAMLQQGILRPGIRRGDLRVVEFSLDELTGQEAREVRVYMDFLLERSMRTRRTQRRHRDEGRAGATAPTVHERIDAARQRMKRRKSDFQAGRRQLGTTNEPDDGLMEYDLLEGLGDSGERSPSSE